MYIRAVRVLANHEVRPAFLSLCVQSEGVLMLCPGPD